MRITAFAASLPLPGDTSQHENTALSHRRIRPVCVAKPPPQKPGSQPRSKPMKRNKRKRKVKGRREGSRAAESLTAAQISEKISQAVGFNLILEDVARLTKFFRFLTKSKPSALANQEIKSEVEPESNSNIHLAIIDDSHSYEPRSVTARRIASSYVKTRGAVDRALQAVSIRAQSYSKAVTRVAGDAIFTILGAGHEAFPGLRLDKARDVVGDVFKDGWTPLSVFQWQLSPGDGEDMEARRKKRIQEISTLLRGTGVDSFLTVTGAALTSVGRTVEKLAPIAFQGVTKRSLRYVEQSQSRKPQSRSLGNAVPGPSQHKRRTQRQEATPRDDVSKHLSFSSASKRTKLFQNAFATSKEVVDQNPKTARAKVRSVTPKSDSWTHHIEKESRVDAESGVPGTSMTRGGGGSTSEPASKRGSGLARGGAIVLAAGAVAAASMTVSIPTAITFSTMVVASMALSGAKAASAAGYQLYGRPNIRQSRSLQSLEGAFTNMSTTSSGKAKELSALDTPAEQIRHVQSGKVSKSDSNSFETGTKFVTNGNFKTIETSSYTVSRSQPSILSAPFIGTFLSCFDSIAFQIERWIGTLLRRSFLKRSEFRSRDVDIHQMMLSTTMSPGPFNIA